MTTTQQQSTPLILTQLSLHQFTINLDKPLPVGKQRIDQRHGLILSAQACQGEDHYQAHVEISPLCGLDNLNQTITGFSQETLEQVQQQLVAALPELLLQPADALLDYSTQFASVAFGLSLLHAKLHGKLDGHFPSPRSVPLIYRAADEPLTAVSERVSGLDRNIHSVKVKVAQDPLEDEIKLIHQILAIRPDLKLRLDANRGFSLEQAIEFAACVPLTSIEYIEEPCQNPADNQTFYHAVEMPWALDESLNSSDYQFELKAGLSALIIKPMLLGSIEKLQQLIETANEHGVRCILSSSLEASLGIDALSRLAQVLTPDEIPGIDTLTAFQQDLVISSGKASCLQLDDLSLIYSVK